MRRWYGPAAARPQHWVRKSRFCCCFSVYCCVWCAAVVGHWLLLLLLIVSHYVQWVFYISDVFIQRYSAAYNHLKHDCELEHDYIVIRRRCRRHICIFISVSICLYCTRMFLVETRVHSSAIYSHKNAFWVKMYAMRYCSALWIGKSEKILNFFG